MKKTLKGSGKINTEAVKNFINTNNDRVIGLFIDYQILELFLHLKLNLPEKRGSLDELNKGINNKTLGKLAKTYNRKYPKDEAQIKALFKTVGQERNIFMHSLWLFLSLIKSEKEMKKVGKQILDQYEKNLGELMERVSKIKDL